MKPDVVGKKANMHELQWKGREERCVVSEEVKRYFNVLMQDKNTALLFLNLPVFLQ